MSSFRSNSTTSLPLRILVHTSRIRATSNILSRNFVMRGTKSMRSCTLPKACFMITCRLTGQDWPPHGFTGVMHRRGLALRILPTRCRSMISGLGAWRKWPKRIGFCTAGSEELPWHLPLTDISEEGSVADRCIPHAARTLHHTWKGSVPKLSGRPNWPLMILRASSTPARTRRALKKLLNPSIGLTRLFILR